MKKTLQKLLVTVVCLLCSIGVYAYDFEVDGIYYNILNETDKTIEVTYKDTGYNSYAGDIVLQETVSYNDELYYIVKIGDRAFSKCDALYTVTLPNNVSNLGIGVFHNSNNLTEIHASNGVSTNSSQIFYNCTSLKSVVIDNNTTIINDEVFRGCSSLNKITIPQNITNLGEYAIAGCSGLIEIKVEAINPPYAESNTFNVIDKSIPVYVPAESVEAYKQAEYWSEFTNIVAIDEDNNSLVAEKVEVAKVDGVMKQEEISLPISLINTDEIAGLQCDIFLPDGLTPVMQGDKYDIVLSSRAEGFDVTAKLRNDGALRVVIVNTALDLISGNDGELFTIKLMPNEQYSTDDHIAIRNIVMTGSDYAEYEASDVVISCTIKESITGDSNCDKKVNVTDLSQMANYVAGNELGVFDADGADANQDGQVDSADIDAVSDVVVKASKAEAQNNTEVTEATENRLEADAIEIVKMNGVVVTNPISLPIALTNTATITAIQCDITVPAGLTLVENDGVADIILSERLGESHVVKSAWLDNGALRVLIYSPTAEGIEGESGTLFTLQLQPNESYQADATIEVKNITIASTDAVEYNAMPLSISCTVKESYKGDVNRDGKVNVTDVIVTIGKVLNVYDGEFDTVAADIDQDGEITIVDAVGIINLVLDEGDTPSQARMQDEYAQGELTMQDVKMSRGETKDLVIGLTNEAPYTAFQMDVTLPAGLNIITVR